MCQRIDEQRQEEAHKKGRLEGYGIGLREGYDVGLKKGEENKQIKEKEMDTWKHGYGHCVSVEEGSLMLVMEVAKAIALKEAKTTRSDSETQTDDITTTDASTQTTPADIAVNAVTQMVPNDEMPRLLNDAGMSTKPPSTCKTAVQANDWPQLAPQTLATHPSTPLNAATSLLTTLTQPPLTTPTLSTTATTTSAPAPKRLLTPQKRQHPLPA